MRTSGGVITGGIERRVREDENQMKAIDRHGRKSDPDKP